MTVQHNIQSALGIYTIVILIIIAIVTIMIIIAIVTIMIIIAIVIIMIQPIVSWRRWWWGQVGQVQTLV